MPDVIIVGGGIIGCATAYYLAREGAHVELFERGEVAGEASGAAAGILAALSDHGERPPLFAQLCKDSLALFDSLLPALAETGIDVRHRRAGILDVAVTEGEVEPLKKQLERRKAQGARWLDGPEACKREPALNPQTIAAVWTPEAQYADPALLTRAIAEAARRAGAAIHEHQPVVRLLKRGDRLRAVQTPEGDHEADEFVLAGGPWTARLALRLGAGVPVRPVRGQMLSLEGPPGGLGHMVWGAGAYLIPREDGQTYVGATVEEAGYRKQTTAQGLRALRSGAAALVPALRRSKQRRAWAGLRPATPDEMPVMGLLPGWLNAWISSGHFRNGILLAPVSGLLMARAIAAGRADELPQELAPQRFEPETSRRERDPLKA